MVVRINITPKRKSLSLFDIFKDWEFEKLNLKFCKYILGVTKKYTNIAVLSELGIYPIRLLIHIYMYWHILENSPSELLSRAFTELKSIVDKTTSSCNNSWYSNLLFYSDNLGIDLNICKNLSRNKFKILLKKKLLLNFQDCWSEIRDTCLVDKGKLDTYFTFKTSYNYENYLDINNVEKRN